MPHKLNSLVGHERKINHSPDSKKDVQDKPVDVFVTPVDNFRYEYAGEFAKNLGKQTGLNVKAMLPTPVENIEPFPGTNQFNALEIIDKMDSTMKRFREDFGPGMVIILTNRDINQPERITRFVFSFNDSNRRAAVISSFRLALGETTALADLDTIKERMMKFSLRCIGEHHFKLSRTTDQNSIMFSPIMSLKDVDRMGTEFLKK